MTNYLCALRTSLALSLVTGKPFRAEHVRANRERPGLRQQHLTAVNAAAEIGQAEVEGAIVGTREFTFVPGKVTPGNYSFNIEQRVAPRSYYRRSCHR